MVTARLPDSPDSDGATRIYAVGDVHGHLDKLLALHELIRRDLAGSPSPRPLLVHLGDYIDRGPDSAGCLALLARASPLPGARMVNLMGNHEAMLLAALDLPTPQAARLWLGNGGDAALASWRIAPDTPPERWGAMIPPDQLALLRGLGRTHLAGRYLFVHAGVRPGIALAAQDPDDLVWIRRPFLDWDGVMLPEAPKRLIVHGHTPSQAVVLRRNRMGLDTNAARGGPLTCAVLDGGPPRFLQV